MSDRDGTAFPVAVSALASTRRAAAGSSTRCCRLFEPPLGPPIGAITSAGASCPLPRGGVVESATGFVGVVSSVLDAAGASPRAEVSPVRPL